MDVQEGSGTLTLVLPCTVKSRVNTMGTPDCPLELAGLVLSMMGGAVARKTMIGTGATCGGRPCEVHVRLQDISIFPPSGGAEEPMVRIAMAKVVPLRLAATERTKG